MPLGPLITTHPKGASQGKTLVDKTGRFNRLQPGFQKQLKKLANDFYQKYQTPLILTDTLRTRAEQAQAHLEKPDLALSANHPNAMHPRGLAVDVDQSQAGKITPEMLAQNGLHLPALSKGETWHIEPKFSSSGGPRPSSQRSLSSAKSFTQRISKLRQQTQLSESLSRLKKQGLAEGGGTDEHRRLQAAMQVEAIFLRQLLEQMRQAMVDSLGPSSPNLRGYLSMADQHLADSLAAGGGLGLAAKILEDLAPPESYSQKENRHEGNPPVPERTDDPGGNLPLSRTS
jgi:Rod binding domain-containing protein